MYTDIIQPYIADFYLKKTEKVLALTIKDIFRKNPYLLIANGYKEPAVYITEAVNALMSSSEETTFGSLLEDIAIEIAKLNNNAAHKSTTKGINLEATKDNYHYNISIKSGSAWGNSSQQAKQEENFIAANRVMKQSRSIPQSHILNILGIMYGKTKPNYLRSAHKLVGQSFWYAISNDKDAYIQIAKDIASLTPSYFPAYKEALNAKIAELTQHFKLLCCNETGLIDEVKLIQFVSENDTDYIDLNNLSL